MAEFKLSIGDPKSGKTIQIEAKDESAIGFLNKKIGDKVFLPDEKAKYDIKYYLNNQILPAAENIFEVFDISVRDVAEGSSQKKLF